MKKIINITSRIIIPVLLTWPCMSLFAQRTLIDWKEKATPHPVNPAFSGESGVLLLDRRVHEYVEDSAGNMEVMITNHRILKAIDDKGVEMYNKVYVPISYDGIITEIKARVLTPGGRTIELPADKILEVEEDGRTFKKFALEGVEKGSEIEYLYRERKRLYFFGVEVFQTSYAPVQEAEFLLSVPERLVFTVKGYNGISVSTDTLVGNERVIYASTSNIPMLEAEKYGEPGPYLRHIQYKLSYNVGKDGSTRLFTWDQLAKNVFQAYNNATEKETRAVAALLKAKRLDILLDEEAKIVQLEDFLKNSFNVQENTIDKDADEIENILKTKVAGQEGMMHLFTTSLNILNVPWQIVFPNKRDALPIDRNLENYRLVNDMLLYFPNTGKFLEPANLSFRYPMVQPYWAATTGLFIRTKTPSYPETVYAAFDTIPMLPYDQCKHNIEVQMHFNESLDSVYLNSKQIFTGYSASMFRPAFHFLPEQQQQDFTRDLIQSVSKSKQIGKIETENVAMTDISNNKPLVISGDVVSADLVEQAGNKILLKFGDVIGPQEEMYQEKPRQLPIMLPYPHVLDRVISLTIPAGYKIKNPDDIIINITGAQDGEDNLGFVSNYTIKDNKLLVNIHEYYKVSTYPLTRLDIYKKVINAAADFNKVVLVFEKQ